MIQIQYKVIKSIYIPSIFKIIVKYNVIYHVESHLHLAFQEVCQTFYNRVQNGTDNLINKTLVDLSYCESDYHCAERWEGFSKTF